MDEKLTLLEIREVMIKFPSNPPTINSFLKECEQSGPIFISQLVEYIYYWEVKTWNIKNDFDGSGKKRVEKRIREILDKIRHGC